MLSPPRNHRKIPHRQLLDPWLYVLCQSCTWRELPREFSSWHSFYGQLDRWARARVLDRVVQALPQVLLVEPDTDTHSLDSTIIHLHMHGTSPRRTGDATRSDALKAIWPRSCMPWSPATGSRLSSVSHLVSATTHSVAASCYSDSDRPMARRA